MPKTRFGSYSLTSMIGAVLLFTLVLFLVISGQRGGDTFFDNLWISIPMVLAGIAAVASLVLGCISIIKAKERSIFVFLCCLLGFLVLIFVAGEFNLPFHIEILSRHDGREYCEQ